MDTPDPVSAALVLSGLWLVGLTNLRTKLAVYGLQTLLLGLLAVSVGRAHHELTLVAVGLAIAVLKGVGVPWFLGRLVRRIGCRRDEGLLLAPPLLLLLTLAALVALVLFQPFGRELALTELPALGLLLIGMVLMISRRLAVSQIVGFLVLENGIFYYTIAQTYPMPLLVELGVLLDALVATMLAGLLVFRLNDRFDHIDVTALKMLRG